jgi:hypothetical protein
MFPGAAERHMETVISIATERSSFILYVWEPRLLFTDHYLGQASDTSRDIPIDWIGLIWIFTHG